MKEIRVNRLPLLTYRYLHTNDTAFMFERPLHQSTISFSDTTYVREGGTLPSDYRGAAPEVTEAGREGEKYVIEIPEGVETNLTISLLPHETEGGFAGQFIFTLHKKSKLRLVWRCELPRRPMTVVLTTDYEVMEGAEVKSSSMEIGMGEATIYDERNVRVAEGGVADFSAAKLGGHQIIVHSYGKLLGDKSKMREAAVYAAVQKQTLDLFYHIEHYGKDTDAKIDVKGALLDQSKKVCRATLDFKKGCSGSTGDEGDYAIQLDPKTKNISLPLLLCTEDNVQGNHASSAGQLDKNTIYFLMTRGFSLEEARRIVVESMICPLVDEMDESVREEIIGAVREKLSAKESL